MMLGTSPALAKALSPGNCKNYVSFSRPPRLHWLPPFFGLQKPVGILLDCFLLMLRVKYCEVNKMIDNPGGSTVK